MSSTNDFNDLNCINNNYGNSNNCNNFSDLDNCGLRNITMQTGNGRCFCGGNCGHRCTCRPIRYPGQYDYAPPILASLFSTNAQTVRTNSDIVFDRNSAIAVGMNLSDAGTELIVNCGGYYNISFGIDANSIIGTPDVHLCVNDALADGTQLKIASTNVMNTLTKIVLLCAGDIIKLREKGGTLVLCGSYVNAFIDINLLESKTR